MIRRHPSGLALAVGLLVGAVWVGCPPAAAAMLYVLTDLGNGGGGGAEAYSINDSGQIVGISYTNARESNDAVRWEAGSATPTRLNTLGGVNGTAYDINAGGQVAGSATVVSRDGHAALWGASTTTPTDLGLGAGYGLNDAGYVVGDGPAGHAAQWSPGSTTPTDLGTLGGGVSHANAINANGQAVGYATTTGNAESHAVRWNADSTKTDLGTLGGTRGWATDINDSGVVVGFADTSGNATRHAVRWDVSGAATDLGTLGGSNSYAYGINANGWAVGAALTAGGIRHAAVWIGSSVFDLNSLLIGSSNWTLIEAYDINSSGQIVGYGSNGIFGGGTHAFLLTPQNQGPENVPEPSSLALLASSLLGGAGFLYRRRTSRG